MKADTGSLRQMFGNYQGLSAAMQDLAYRLFDSSLIKDQAIDCISQH